MEDSKKLVKESSKEVPEKEVVKKEKEMEELRKKKIEEERLRKEEEEEREMFAEECRSEGYREAMADIEMKKRENDAAELAKHIKAISDADTRSDFVLLFFLFINIINIFSSNRKESIDRYSKEMQLNAIKIKLANKNDPIHQLPTTEKLMSLAGYIKFVATLPKKKDNVKDNPDNKQQPHSLPAQQRQQEATNNMAQLMQLLGGGKQSGKSGTNAGSGYVNAEAKRRAGGVAIGGGAQKNLY